MIYYRPGEYANAEAAANMAMVETPDQFRRNQALIYVHLGRAQLLQGEVEYACSNVSRSFELMRDSPAEAQSGQSIPGRMRTLIGDFHRCLIHTAPTSSTVQEWTDRNRSEWIQQQ